MPEIDSPPAPTVVAKGSSILRRKVFGVPVLYLAVLVVAVLVFFAWKSKTSASADTNVEAPVAEEDLSAGETQLGGDVYPGMPVGTVIVAPTTDATTDNASITTNDEWLSKGVAYLIKRGNGAGASQLALQTYLEGAVLTYTQGAMRDAVIVEYGLPPNPPFAGETLPKVKPPTIPKPAPAPAPLPKPKPTPAPKPKPVPLPKPKPAPAPKNTPKIPYPGHYIKRGSKGSAVVLVQRKVGATADGDFGPKTEAAVKSWQKSHGLSADGIVGPLTWAKMFG